MKKFETVTELEILNAAHSWYLSKWYKEICILDKNPNDYIAKTREPKLKKIYRFLVEHLNENSITCAKDIEVFDELFTSIVAYHKC